MASSGWRCCPCCRRALDPPVSVTPVHELPVRVTDTQISTRKGDIRRIVLLGKTGAGKSSIANTIFGEKDVFEVCHDAVSGTKRCRLETRRVKGRDIQLIDTPGFFDTEIGEFKEQIIKTIIETRCGIHTFLLLLKVERYTEQEKAVVGETVKYFSAEALKYTTVVFTHGDDLPEGRRIHSWLYENEALRDLVQKCGGRCHVFDNRYWNNSKHPYRNNEVQLDLLLNTIDETVDKNGGRHYSNDLLKSVYDKIQEEKEHIRKEKPTLKEEDVNKQAEASIYTYMWDMVSKYGVNLLSALLGKVTDTVTGGVMNMLGWRNQ